MADTMVQLEVEDWVRREVKWIPPTQLSTMDLASADVGIGKEIMGAA